MSSIEVEWRVTWFPPDVKDRTKIASEAAVRRTAREQEELGNAPIIERREIVVGEWETVENKTLGITESPPGYHGLPESWNPDND